MSESDVVNGFNIYKEAASKMGLKPLHAHISMEKGFAYCLTEAPSANEVREAHANAVPLEDVVEVKTIT
ncbi:MAG: hypothetical protein A2864_02785 [Candidatus Woykebacteria bacterium RIFCSPHIGHO2_01_FULL_39_12]|uniref:DUF4242 domain-containing protein n=1 Tax=Candidatus Woykebacteria bacterium RIFCSPHIGHO2_01_FULL_39_12 TaxID=1802599 RepID=A0A1G1WJ20_9BACT|nr:MAG: hypothetical protein A2864_02785 [Candidatus Woykebacteria bacterium RIFCSPHIGHO2_01_FULL_39_12]